MHLGRGRGAVRGLAAVDSLRPQPVRRVRRLLHDVSLHHHARLPDQRPPHAPPQGGLPAHDQCVGVHGRQHAHHNVVLLSSIVLALTTNPTLGLLGAGLLLVLLFAFMFFIAPLCYCGTMLLHEEVVHVLKKREEKRHWPAPAPTPAPALAPSRPPALTPPPALASVLPKRRQRLLPPSYWPGVGADLPLGLPSRALACPPRLRRRLTQVCSPPKLGRWPGAAVLDDAAPHSTSSPPELHQWSEHRERYRAPRCRE